MKPQKLKISVVLPVYNGEKYIIRSVESVQAQSYYNWELIVVDDGSADSTPRIVQDFVKTDARIRLIRQKNQGVSAARNRGIKEASGELLMFLDADDWFEKTALETVIRNWDDSMQMLLFDYYDVPANGKRQYRKHFKENKITFGTDGGYSMDKLILTMSGFYQESKSVISGPWGKAWKTSLIKNSCLAFPEDVFYREDQIFCINASMEMEKVLYLSVPVYNYYINTGSVTHATYCEDGERLISNITDCNHYIRKFFASRKTALYENAYYKYVFDGVKVILWWLAEEEEKDRKKQGRDYCYTQAKQVSAHVCETYSMVDKVLLRLCEKQCFRLIDIVVGTRKKIKRLLHIR